MGSNGTVTTRVIELSVNLVVTTRDDAMIAESPLYRKDQIPDLVADDIREFIKGLSSQDAITPVVGCRWA